MSIKFDEPCGHVRNDIRRVYHTQLQHLSQIAHFVCEQVVIKRGDCLECLRNDVRALEKDISEKGRLEREVYALHIRRCQTVL
jgi:hypothetical protein